MEHARADLSVKRFFCHIIFLSFPRVVLPGLLVQSKHPYRVSPVPTGASVGPPGRAFPALKPPWETVRDLLWDEITEEGETERFYDGIFL
jgi:hypothetical protein